MRNENPDDSLLAEIEGHAVNIAREAGQILCEQFRQPLEVQFKGKKNSDPVTTADRLADEYLKKAIREKFPRHGILSEEGATQCDSDSPFVWVIDPLDGTSNFMNGLPLFASSIGVLWKSLPVVGSIFVPVSHQATEGVYHGRLNKGAFFNTTRIEVNMQPSGRPLSQIPLHLRSHFRFSGPRWKEPHETRNLGSIALELAMAASGVFQYALFGRPKLWDVSAGVLLIKEAGGLSFFRRPGDKRWLNLERFQVERDNATETLEKLREWSFPLFVGAPYIAGKLVQDLQIRHHPLSELMARFRRGGKNPADPARK